MDSLLIVRLGAVGDGLLLAPALASLRRCHPHARIDLAGIAWRLRLLMHPTLANDVVPIAELFDGDQVDRDRLERYEHVVVFAIDLSEPVVRSLVEADPGRVRSYHSFPIERASATHVVEHIRDCLSPLGIEDHAQSDYCIPGPGLTPSIGPCRVSRLFAAICTSARAALCYWGTARTMTPW
jgi:hypothetical protein